MRCHLLTLLPLVLLLAPAGPSAANVFGEDDRQLADREGVFAAVVAVTQDEDDPLAASRFGSGTLVTRCHVLTAHHVAFDDPRGAQAGAVSLVHLGPPGADFPFSRTERAHAVLWGDLAAHAHEDWALLELERCLGPEWRPWPLLSLDFESAEAFGEGFSLAGHPAWATRAAVTVDPRCRLHEARGSVEGWWHDCATQVGQSGGPLYLLDEAGLPQVVAVAIGDFSPQRAVIPQWDPRAANVAVPVANFVGLLQSVLEAETRAAEP